MTDDAIAELTAVLGSVRAACKAAGRPQANHYRRHRQSPKPGRDRSSYGSYASFADPGPRLVHRRQRNPVSARLLRSLPPTVAGLAAA